MADVDVVVIGSGAGGLSAAVALAQAGQRVLVLEQHYLPGGWCHSFTLDGYRFSPGVHYIGELGPGGAMRRIYDGLGVSGELTFCELNPDGFDHILVGGERFDYPKGKAALRDRLAARFPKERKGITGYLDTLSGLSKELNDLVDLSSITDVLKLPFKAPHVARWGLSSAQSMIHGHVRDPLLRAFLEGQCGDHGLPASRASAPVHAAVAAHYFDGGWYPRGGAYTIPRAFIKVLKRHGGELQVRAPVAKILTEGGRAIGVRLKDGTEIRARQVISNADPGVTYGKLLAPDDVPAAVKRKLSRTRYSCSALSLFLAVDMDLRGAGMDSGNFWYYANRDIDGIYERGLTDWTRDAGELPGLFLTATTLKDPSKLKKGHHTLEAFTFVSKDAFRRWATSAYGDRPEEYQALKRALTNRMLEGLERIVPGLSRHVVFSDLGTPLTNEHYVAATEGNLYGTEKSRFQVGPFGFGLNSGIPGLTLCGASTLGHGVMGASVSGLMAAKRILRCKTAELLTPKAGSLTLLPSERYDQWPERLRKPKAEPREATLRA